MATLELRQITKSYGTMPVIHGVDLAIADQEFVVFVGPSGCGKSTILRMIAGLEDISGGDLLIGGARMNDVPTRHRNLAMVFQDYALYPHMTVAANLGFGLRMHGVAAADRARRVREVAELLQLGDYLDRRPRALSGGQRQRVAMGRALARSAQLFLFDEPLSNLDAKLRIEVRTQIKLLHRSLGMTSVFVTHDQTEAMTMADRIVCLDGGRIAQIGAPEELYNRPATVFVATFIGSPQINLFEGEIAAADGAPVLRLADGQCLTLPESMAKDLPPGPVVAGLRPEDLTDAARLPGLTAPAALACDAILSETLGSDVLVIGTLGGVQVTARCSPGLSVGPGDRIRLHADAAKLHFFSPGTRARL
ncbi:MAG: sn-glycerol-3-phosphate ABC transporter ATP-binding protein UgpC [Rubellimicrobium sp.]|nr:sn-glycerol-3-phosphate ABC transporter ATP-binding protein UgpC [Rubellimicrobium sp.]